MDRSQTAPADQAAEVRGSVGFCSQVPARCAAGLPGAGDPLRQC